MLMDRKIRDAKVHFIHKSVIRIFFEDIEDIYQISEVYHLAILLLRIFYRFNIQGKFASKNCKYLLY